MNLSLQKQGGMGLLSLLAGMAVVAVLATLGLGMFTRAQEQARAARCMNNLRQIGIALHAYLADHSGRYPPNRSNLAYKDEENPAGVHWQDALKRYLKPYPDSGNITGEMAGVFWCPADLARKERLAQHSYGANTYIGGLEPPEKQTIRLEPNPGKRLYLVEATRSTLSTCNFSHNTWPFNNGPQGQPNTTVYVDFRHRGTAHGLFLDGRVAALREKDLRGQNPYTAIAVP